MCPERPVKAPIAIAALVGATVFVALPTTGGANLDGAPPGHTGGFGEPSCHTCHFDGPVDDREGSLTLATPESFVPGRDYRVEVRLRHPRLARGGFQLSARFAEGPRAGDQAGEISATGSEVLVVEGRDDLQYASHSPEGVHPVAAHEIAWSFCWSAPEGAPAPVVFHAAANAANYDDSELGDVVLVEKARAEPGN